MEGINDTDDGNITTAIAIAEVANESNSNNFDTTTSDTNNHVSGQDTNIPNNTEQQQQEGVLQAEVTHIYDDLLHYKHQIQSVTDRNAVVIGAAVAAHEQQQHEATGFLVATTSPSPSAEVSNTINNDTSNKDLSNEEVQQSVNSMPSPPHAPTLPPPAELPPQLLKSQTIRQESDTTHKHDNFSNQQGDSFASTNRVQQQQQRLAYHPSPIPDDTVYEFEESPKSSCCVIL